MAETKPRKRDPEARREAILEAAAEMTIESGSASLTHRAVAARAGESLGSMTRLFSSIDDLREASLQRLADDLNDELTDIERTIAAAPNFIAGCTQVMVEFLSDKHVVRSSIALVTTSTTDPKTCELELAWSARFHSILQCYVSKTAAAALEQYFNGLMVHVALHDAMPVEDEMVAVIRALGGLPDVFAVEPSAAASVSTLAIH